MTDKLAEICATKREEVAARKGLATLLNSCGRPIVLVDRRVNEKSDVTRVVSPLIKRNRSCCRR